MHATSDELARRLQANAPLVAQVEADLAAFGPAKPAQRRSRPTR